MDLAITLKNKHHDEPGFWEHEISLNNPLAIRNSLNQHNSQFKKSLFISNIFWNAQVT